MSMQDELNLKIINVHDTGCLIIDEGDIKQSLQASAKRSETDWRIAAVTSIIM